MAAPFSVASFNLHGGVDAWGRPFDEVDAVLALDADVVILQECWTPRDGSGVATEVAERMGGTAHHVILATGRRAQPLIGAPSTWHRRRSFIDGDHALYLDSELPMSASLAASARYQEAEPGSWGLAIVSRLGVRSTTVTELGRLRRDRARRVMLATSIDVEGSTVNVVGVHMTHLSYGSPLHFRRVRHALDALGGPSSATVIGGDMNLWGPLVVAQLPGWRRAVRAKTWPSWGAHSQLDHLLVGRGLHIVEGRVVDDRSSDHLPVRAVLEVAGSGA